MKRSSVRAHLLLLMILWMAAISFVVFFALSSLRADRNVVFDITYNHMPSIQSLQVMQEAFTELSLTDQIGRAHV